MEIKVLGSVSPYPKANNNCPGYLISDNNKLLLDCGSGALRFFDMKDLENLKVVISHFHKDHYSDLFSLAYATYVYHNLGMLDKKVDVYLPSPKTKEEYIDYNYITSSKEKYINYIDYDETTKIEIDDEKISFKIAKHNITTYYAKIENKSNKIVYSADTGYNEELIDFSKNADVLICESSFLSYQKKDNNNHLSAYEAGMIASKAHVKKLLLTHFWPEIEKQLYVKEARKVFFNTIGAEENKVLKLERSC